MSEPAPGIERTDSAIKIAEEAIQGKKTTTTTTTAVDSPTSAILTAMEITQPGSSKKLVASKAAEAAAADESKEKKVKSKHHKKKGKKDKEKKGEEKEAEDEVETKMLVTVKHLEERYDEQGYQQIQEPGSGPPEKSKEDKWANYILCETRHFNYEQRYTHRTLEIKSKHLKAVLKKVIYEYPTISFRTAKIKLSFPLRVLYHYLDELKAELEVMKRENVLEKEPREKKQDKKDKKDKKKDKKDDGKKGDGPSVSGAVKEETKEEVKDPKKEEEQRQQDADEAIEHLEYLVTFLENEFQETIKDVANLIPHGLITYEILWTIFKPGLMVYAQSHHNQQRCLKLERGDYAGGREPNYQLTVNYVDYDGKSFGMAETNVSIYPFEGTTKINGLNAFPLKFHPREAAVKKFLIERGRRFEGYKGCHYMEYKGIGLGEVVRCRRVQYNINGRVMCDAETYNRINPDRAISIKALPGHDKTPKDDDYDLDDEWLSSDEEWTEKCGATGPAKPLTDEQCLLSNFLISGFALGEKKWVDFYIDNLSPIQWNENAFDQLVLPTAQKSLVRALVESHVRDIDGFDDIIKGKGKGLISILHGPPGVGKTLTAESVAEHTRRPLYAVSSGELGVNPGELEENLSKILDVATTWKAVLLLDEADVFLETRSLHDLKRNSLVSIFLRLLEYYQGILFLTSNRVTTFDEAFQSRIHVALKYNKLDKDARAKVWQNFMNFNDIKGGKELLEVVINRELNGRQIKNCVRTARSLAESEGKKVELSHLMMVLDIQQQFEKDFGGVMQNGV